MCSGLERADQRSRFREQGGCNDNRNGQHRPRRQRPRDRLLSRGLAFERACVANETEPSGREKTDSAGWICGFGNNSAGKRLATAGTARSPQWKQVENQPTILGMRDERSRAPAIPALGQSKIIPESRRQNEPGVRSTAASIAIVLKRIGREKRSQWSDRIELMDGRG
jgi:hypothetical protein